MVSFLFCICTHGSSECVTVSECVVLLFCSASESILLEAHANTRMATYDFEQRLSKRLTRTLWLSAKVFLFLLLLLFFFIIIVCCLTTFGTKFRFV